MCFGCVQLVSKQGGSWDVHGTQRPTVMNGLGHLQYAASATSFPAETQIDQMDARGQAVRVLYVVRKFMVETRNCIIAI